MAETQIVFNIAPATAEDPARSPLPKTEPVLMCPSAQPDMAGARVLGVVGGTTETAQVAYLNEALPVNHQLLASTAPLKPTEVFRFAAHCEGKACRHFDGTNCNLATRIVQILPAVVDALPACLIRPTCRWYQQEGRAACMRCPQVVTESYEPSEDFKRAALGEGH
jgi:hypothetical protein